MQFGSALLLCVLFYLLRRHAARRAYFGIWARAWLVMIVAMAVVILYNLPAQLGPPGTDVTGLQRGFGRFSYNFAKLLAVSLFVIGPRVYAFGNESRASFVWGTAVAALIGISSVLFLDVTTRGVVLQAPFIALALSYCGGTLLTLPHSRKSLGSRLRVRDDRARLAGVVRGLRRPAR